MCQSHHGTRRIHKTHQVDSRIRQQHSHDSDWQVILTTLLDFDSNENYLRHIRMYVCMYVCVQERIWQGWQRLGCFDAMERQAVSRILSHSPLFVYILKHPINGLMNEEKVELQGLFKNPYCVWTCQLYNCLLAHLFVAADTKLELSLQMPLDLF